MFWSSVRNIPHTVVGRLMIGYALSCTVFSIITFILLSGLLDRNIQRRIDNDLRNELSELGAIYTEQGLRGIQREFNFEAESDGLNNIFFRLLSPEGDVLATSNISEWEGLEREIRALNSKKRMPSFFTLYPRDNELNCRMIMAPLPGTSCILQVGTNLHSNNVFRAKFQRIFFAFSVAMLLLSTIAGGWIAHHALSGVKRVTKAVSTIRRGHLNQRVPFGSEGREIDDLVAEFNHMIGRINSLIAELKAISDNVAHDLRSPITRIRGITETTLTGPQNIELYREMGLTTIEESDRLTQMINTTLEVAQAESGLLEVDRHPLEMGQLLRNAVELFQPVADEKQIALTAEIPEDPLVLFGDKTRLQRVIANLLDNAIKYTPSLGKIHLSAVQNEEAIYIRVVDTGVGINPAESDRIFDRFYRGEKSRSTSGNGLGLSLARVIVQAHGGTVSVETNPQGGSIFIVNLPVSVV